MAHYRKKNYVEHGFRLEIMISTISWLINQSEIFDNGKLTLPKKRDLRALDSLVIPSSANPSASASYPATSPSSNPLRTA